VSGNTAHCNFAVAESVREVACEAAKWVSDGNAVCTYNGIWQESSGGNA